MTYTISDECVVCWKCIDICAFNSINEIEIKMTTQYAIPGVQIDVESCTACGLCIEVCPVDAIADTA